MSSARNFAAIYGGGTTRNIATAVEWSPYGNFPGNFYSGDRLLIDFDYENIEESIVRVKHKGFSGFFKSSSSANSEKRRKTLS
jgi:hypothetical protein